MNELRKIAREAAAEVKPGEHVCKYCGLAFTRESSLVVHQCEPKRRENQKGEKGVRIGYIAWLRFFESLFFQEFQPFSFRWIEP